MRKIKGPQTKGGVFLLPRGFFFSFSCDNPCSRCFFSHGGILCRCRIEYGYLSINQSINGTYVEGFEDLRHVFAIENFCFFCGWGFTVGVKRRGEEEKGKNGKMRR